MELTPLLPLEFCLCGQIQAAWVPGSAAIGDMLQRCKLRPIAGIRNTLCLSPKDSLTLEEQTVQLCGKYDSGRTQQALGSDFAFLRQWWGLCHGSDLWRRNGTCLSDDTNPPEGQIVLHAAAPLPVWLMAVPLIWAHLTSLPAQDPTASHWPLLQLLSPVVVQSLLQSGLSDSLREMQAPREEAQISLFLPCLSV